MSAIIIYATKHGTSDKCANLLAEKMGGDVKVVNIDKDEIPCLHCPDTVIIGFSVYAGRIPKKIAKLLETNEALLLEKKLGLFMCCSADTDDDVREQIERLWPAKLREHAVSVENFGGEIIWEKLNFLERTAIKIVSKQAGSRSNLKPEAIERMASAMR
jgi:menaquinone-dependent protoporphyrinogen oxidase